VPHTVSKPGLVVQRRGLGDVEVRGSGADRDIARGLTSPRISSYAANLGSCNATVGGRARFNL